MKAKGFYRKRKGILHEQKKAISTGVNKLSYCSALHGSSLILSSERMSIIISPCGQIVCFFLLGLQILVCKTMLFCPSSKLFCPGHALQRFKEQDRQRKFLWNDCSDSIIKWVYLVNFSCMLVLIVTILPEPLQQCPTGITLPTPSLISYFSMW